MQKDGRGRVERWKEWRVARRAREGVVRILHLKSHNLDCCTDNDYEELVQIHQLNDKTDIPPEIRMTIKIVAGTKMTK